MTHCEENNEANAKLIDYDTLTHTINLLYLRAGNHDSKGQNQYFLKIYLVGLLDEESEHLIDFEKKRKIIEEYQIFGDLDLPAFTKYERQEKDRSNIKTKIEGDAIRELVRKVMNTLAKDDKNKEQKEHIPEAKVGIMVKLVLYEKEKKYFLLSDDQKIKEVEYFALPFKSSDQVLYEDKVLEFDDKQGLQAKIEIKYDLNNEKK